MIHTPRLRGRGWQRIRRSVLMAEPLCRACKGQGIVKAADEIDHVQPLHKGGGNDRGNLQPLCADCHAAKTYTDAHGAPKPEPIRAKDW